MIDRGDFVPQEQFMRVALEEAHLALRAGESPVGACIVGNDQVVARAHNAVITTVDTTAHAEIATIRAACSAQRVLNLSNCHLYVTVEPCAMCFGACYYAGLSTIVFGAGLHDIRRITGSELARARPDAGSEPTRATVVGDFLRAECVALLDEWALLRQGLAAS